MAKKDDLKILSICKKLEIPHAKGVVMLFNLLKHWLNNAKKKNQASITTNHHKLANELSVSNATTERWVASLKKLGAFEISIVSIQGYRPQLEIKYIDSFLNNYPHHHQNEGDKPSKRGRKTLKMRVISPQNEGHIYKEVFSNNSLSMSKARQTDDHLKMIEIWNELIKPPDPEKPSKTRDKRCREVLVAHFDSDIEQWKNYCSRIASSSFLMGEKFTLTLGWALKAEWIEKVLKGDYDDHEWRKENDMARKKEPVRLGSITLEDVLASCKNEVDRNIKLPLYQQLGADQYASWIHRTGAAFYLEGNQLCVNSCGVFVQSQIKQRFWDKIEKIYNNSYAEMKKGENAYVS